MTYEYKNYSTGYIITRDYEIGTAPDKVRYRGLWYKRVFSANVGATVGEAG